jgi:ferritin-like metal-binding protein YciE
MAGLEAARSVFITGARNAHAVETQATQLLSRQVERLEHYPKLEARMRQHIDETKQQMARLEEILAELGDAPSAMKDAALALTGNMAALTHAVAEDEVVKNSFANFAFENFEIASYKGLIVFGEAAGLGKYGSLLKQSLSEEQAMADFIDANLKDTLLTYVKLESAGETAGV